MTSTMNSLLSASILALGLGAFGITGASAGNSDAAYQPLKIVDASFQQDMPHHVGACPEAAELRFDYVAQGSGQVQFRVLDNDTLLFSSMEKPYDEENGTSSLYFYIFTSDVQAEQFGQQIEHNLTLHVRVRDAKSDTWEDSYQLLDQDVWTQRCTPEMTAETSGGDAVRGNSLRPTPALWSRP
jgi:hypothetical protein